MDTERLKKYYNERELAILRSLYNIRTASYNITKTLNSLLSEHGYEITIDQWRMLRWLYVEEKETLSNLCHITKEDLGAVSRLLSRLEKIGYVKRTRDSKDKRKRYISLTGKSKSAREGLFKLAKGFATSLFHNFSDDEIAQFEKMLEKVLDNSEALKP